MISITITLSIFICAVLSHIFLYRLLVVKKIKSFYTIAVFAVGLVILIILSDKLSLPATSFLLYILAASVYTVFFTSPYLSDKSPSTMIILSLFKYRSLSESEIIALFSDEELIIKRISDLEKSGLVKWEKDRIIGLPKGKKLIELMAIYRKILKWEEGG